MCRRRGRGAGCTRGPLRRLPRPGRRVARQPRRDRALGQAATRRRRTHPTHDPRPAPGRLHRQRRPGHRLARRAARHRPRRGGEDHPSRRRCHGARALRPRSPARRVAAACQPGQRARCRRHRRRRVVPGHGVRRRRDARGGAPTRRALGRRCPGLLPRDHRRRALRPPARRAAPRPEARQPAAHPGRLGAHPRLRPRQGARGGAARSPYDARRHLRRHARLCRARAAACGRHARRRAHRPVPARRGVLPLPDRRLAAPARSRSARDAGATAARRPGAALAPAPGPAGRPRHRRAAVAGARAGASLRDRARAVDRSRTLPHRPADPRSRRRDPGAHRPPAAPLSHRRDRRRRGRGRARRRDVAGARLRRARRGRPPHDRPRVRTC